MSAAAGEGSSGGGKGGEGCKVCGKGGKLVQCSKCHMAKYCGPECQKEDWKGHKKECGKLAIEYSHQQAKSATDKYAEGRYQQSRRAFEKSVQVQREHQGGGREHEVELATSLLSMGSALGSEGRFEEALAKLNEGLGMALRLHGEEHELVADAYYRIGSNVYTALDKTELAAEYLQKSLKLRVKLLGPESIEVAMTLNGIANVLDAAGMTEQAFESYTESLRIKRLRLGSEHPSIGTTLNNIGNVLRAQGKFEEALAKHQEALRIQTKSLGPDHPEAAGTVNNIAFNYQVQGNLPEAIRIYREALRARRKRLGDAHPDVGKAHQNIGGALSMNGEFEEALGHVETALKIISKAFGEDSVQTADARLMLATTCKQQGSDNAKACRMFKECAEVYARLLGPDHMKTKTALFHSK